MRVYLILIVFFSSIQFLFAQEIKVRVLGKIGYRELADKKKYHLIFENNPLVCNPITQNIPITNQIENLKKELKFQNFSYTFSKINNSDEIPFVKEIYALELSANCDFEKLEKIINSLGITINKSNFMFNNNFESQDAKAILAFKDAEKKANQISKILNLESKSIISIDDDSSGAELTDLLDSSQIPEEDKEKFFDFLMKLNEMDFSSSSQNYRDGGYSIWVTYLIR